GERQGLPLAEELLAEVGFELQGFIGQRARDFVLLDSLGVLQLLFAELEHLAVVEPERSDADEQKCAEHNPEDAQPARLRKLEGFYGHENPCHVNANGEEEAAQRDESTGVGI